ncbi:hypothetical protein BGX30_014871, partial [Mortierella sp. GBA39]
MYTENIDRLQIEVYENRLRMGEAAGKAVGAKLQELLAAQERVRMIFAAAPSQNEMLAWLCIEQGIDWKRVTAFHMDEYLGLPQGAPQLFSRFLDRHLFDLVAPGQVHLIRGDAEPAEEIKRYGELLLEAPIDIVCLGIGENGHIAFNDPPVADFEDPAAMKVVELDETCRRQQVNDGCFVSLGDVPTHAITLTIPTLMAGKHLFCTVPGGTKRQALKA